MGKTVENKRSWAYVPARAAINLLIDCQSCVYVKYALFGVTYSFVACLSHLTIDHASLSRRSTVPTPDRHLQHLGAHFHILHRNFSLILSPSCFIVCGHHLFPRIAIVFSLLSSLPDLPCHIRQISSSLLTHPVPQITFSYYVSPTLYCCATRAHICSRVLLLLTTGISLSLSFFC